MQIRRAAPGDAADVAALHVASWQAAYPGLLPQPVLDGLAPEQWAPRWTATIGRAAWPSRGTLLALEADRVRGFVDLRPDADDDAGGVGEIASFYVHPASWSTGVGQALMSVALRTFAAAGFTTAALWVLDGNTRAIRFYTRAGWTFDGTARADVVGGETVHDRRMTRRLHED